MSAGGEVETAEKFRRGHPDRAAGLARFAAIHQTQVLEPVDDRAFVAGEVAVDLGQGKRLLGCDAGEHLQTGRAQRPFDFLVIGRVFASLHGALLGQRRKIVAQRRWAHFGRGDPHAAGTNIEP